MDDYGGDGGRGGRGVAGRTVEATDDDVDDTAELDAAQIAHHVLLRFAAHLHTIHLPCVCNSLPATIRQTEWLASRVVSVLDSGAEGPGFKSQSRRCRITVLKANCSDPLCLCSPSSEIGSNPLKRRGGN